MNLPNNWKTCKLEECLDILDSQRVPINSSEREARLKSAAKTYPYYGATGQVGEIDDYLFDQEAVLLGEDGAPFFELHKAKAYIVSGKYWVNNHAHILAARDGILNKYVCHQLNILNYKNFVAGTTRLKLTQASMKTIPIKIAPTNEQRRIVSKIEELFSDLDAGEAALRKAQRLIEMYRQSVIQEAFKGNFAFVKLGEVVDGIVGGGTPAKDVPSNFQGNIPFMTVKDMRVSRPKDTIDHITQEALQQSSARLISADTIIIATRMGLGKVVRPVVDVAINQDLKAIFPSQRVDKDYLEKWLLSKARYIEENGKGTTVKGVRLEFLKNMEIPVPPLSQQKEIAAKVDNLLAENEKTLYSIQNSYKFIASLRQSILKQAFEGKLVPQDPADEPASELLKRIYTQSSQPKATRGRKKKATA